MQTKTQQIKVNINSIWDYIGGNEKYPIHRGVTVRTIISNNVILFEQEHFDVKYFPLITFINSFVPGDFIKEILLCQQLTSLNWCGIQVSAELNGCNLGHVRNLIKHFEKNTIIDVLFAVSEYGELRHFCEFNKDVVKFKSIQDKYGKLVLIVDYDPKQNKCIIPSTTGTYSVVEKDWMGPESIIHANISQKEAKLIADYYNTDCDAYTSYGVKLMPTI